MMTLIKLSPAERAVWGECPVCHSGHGHSCIAISAADIDIIGKIAHIARLVNAPKLAATETPNAS